MSKKTLLNESQVRQFMKLAKLEPLTPGFVTGLKEGGMYRDEDEDMDESHGRGRGEGDAGYGHPDNNTRPKGLTEEEGLEAQADDLEDAEADMDHADALEDDAAEDLGDIDPAADAEAAGRMVAVEDFLSALESALEDVMGDEVEIDSDEMSAPEEVDVDMGDDAGMEMDVEVEDEEMLEEEKKQGADDREDEHLGMEDGKEADKKQSEKDRRKEMRGARRADDEDGDPVPTQENVDATDELVEQITKRVAARILKSALAKK
jgi:hypothetical protein